MQILFKPKMGPEAYTGANGNGEYPDAPEKCPHKECGTPVKLKKHGFYKRYVYIGTFKGQIRVRRYKCPVCGRTVSMLPAFCVPRFQYGMEAIVGALRDVMAEGVSVRGAAKKWTVKLPPMAMRRHIAYYRRRFKENEGLMMYGLKQVSPGSTVESNPEDATKWTKEFFLEISQMHMHAFNAEFHKETGMSFMSLRNIIA